MIDLPDGGMFVAVFTDPRFYAALGIGLLTGLVRGFSGFGSALVYIPLVSAVYDPRIAAITFVVQDIATGFLSLPSVWRKTCWPEVIPMLISAVIAVQFGALILLYADTTFLRWSVCVLVALAVCILGLGWRYHGRPRLPITVAVGLGSGLMAGAVQISGPLILIYWLGGSHPPAVLRANFFAFFSFLSVAALVTYVLHDMVTAELWIMAIVITPVCMLGMWLGSKAFGLASEKVYRRTAFTIIAISAIIGLPVWDQFK